MLRFATWKIVAIVSMTVLALLVILPSLLPPDTREALTARLPGWVPVRSIVLGLDLQGGSHVLLEVDTASVVKTQVDNLRDDAARLEKRLRQLADCDRRDDLVRKRVDGLHSIAVLQSDARL